MATPTFSYTPRTAATIVTGNRAPENMQTGRIIADVSDTIHLYAPSANPFSALTKQLRGKRKATQYRFDWFEKDELPRSSTVLTTGITDSGTSIEVAASEGGRFRAGDLVLNVTTREVLLVTAVASDVLTVTRGWGSTAAAMASGQTLTVLGPSAEDGSTLPTVKTVKEEAKYNYTQIIRTAVSWTGRQVNTDYYGGSDVMNERKVAGIEHQKSIENLFFFGTRNSATGTHVRSTTGGLDYFISGNAWDLGATAPTENGFLTYLEYAMRWGKGGYQSGNAEKFLFHSARWASFIETLAKAKLQTFQDESTYGIKILKYKTAHGVLNLVHAPVLDYEHKDFAFLVDLNQVRFVFHQGRDTKLLKNRQENDLDALEEEYFSDIGLEVQLDESHGVVYDMPAV